MHHNKSEKQNILHFAGRFSPAVVLIIGLILCLVAGNVAGRTFAYYSTQLGAYSESAHVAEWNVSIGLDTFAVALKTDGWSTPWKLEIKNHSEVLASYGYEGPSVSESSYSYLTIDFDSENGGGRKTAISGVRIFDPDTGNISVISSEIQNNSIVIRFTGTLYPNETKTYYFQFQTDVSVSSAAARGSESVTATAEFHYVQAFEEIESGFAVEN